MSLEEEKDTYEIKNGCRVYTLKNGDNLYIKLYHKFINYDEEKTETSRIPVVIQYNFLKGNTKIYVEVEFGENIYHNDSRSKGFLYYVEVRGKFDTFMFHQTYSYFNHQIDLLDIVEQLEDELLDSIPTEEEKEEKERSNFIKNLYEWDTAIYSNYFDNKFYIDYTPSSLVTSDVLTVANIILFIITSVILFLLVGVSTFLLILRIISVLMFNYYWGLF